jgi:hypothetical protein
MVELIIHFECDRCGEKKPSSVIMSMFNLENLCTRCKDIERGHPLYKIAYEREVEEIRKGNLNFEGIGLPDDLKPNASFENKTINDI